MSGTKKTGKSMRILITIPDIVKEKCIFLGPAYLSAALRKKGYETKLLHFRNLECTKENIVRSVKAYNPDLILVSILSTHSTNRGKFFVKTVKENFNVPVLLGGVAVTVAPEEFINEPYVDMICIGEGEGAVLDVADAVKNNQSVENIPNLWVKTKDGTVKKNKPRPLIANLDDMPFADRNLFSDDIGTKENPRYDMEVLGSRGCPFSCTYCINRILQELYSQQPGKFVRYRSPKNVIDELLSIKEKYAPKSIWFYDETFTANLKWLREFATLYKENNISIPLNVTARPETVNQQVIDYLKDANVEFVRIGVESGDEEVRRKILNRHMSDEQIDRALKLLKKNNILVKTYNMVGIPEETKMSVFKTILMNVGNDIEIAQYTIFQPYPSTFMYDYCKSKNYIVKRMEEIKGVWEESPLSTPKLSKRDVQILFLMTLISRKRIVAKILKAMPRFLKYLSLYSLFYTIKFTPLYNYLENRRRAMLTHEEHWHDGEYRRVAG